MTQQGPGVGVEHNDQISMYFKRVLQLICSQNSQCAKEPHPVWGMVGGHAIYGIKHIGVVASSLSMIVRDCVEAEDIFHAL